MKCQILENVRGQDPYTKFMAILTYYVSCPQHYKMLLLNRSGKLDEENLTWIINL
jgi:hypothetical protein